MEKILVVVTMMMIMVILMTMMTMMMVGLVQHHLSFCVVCPAPVGLYRAALIPLTLQHYAFSTLYSILFYAGILFHIGILYCTDIPFHTSFFPH